MDYKEKYNKLVKAVKVLQEANPSDDGIQNWVNDNVPELRESEDERIRKEILEYFQQFENEELRGVNISDWIAWLEKQGDANKEYWRGDREGKKEILDKYSELEKQDEHKPINYADEKIAEAAKDISILDMAEPKFKVGDWVVDKNGMVKQILYYKDGIYKHTDGYSAEIFEDEWRLWDITKDAKDGDVLFAENFDKIGGCVFLFKGLDSWKFDAEGDRAIATGYCCISITESGNTDFGIQGPDCVEIKRIHPAIKKQRELLFQKMHEAGYTFDFEKKELRKLKFRVGDEVITENEDSLTITRIDEEGYWSNDLFICDFDSECNWDLVEHKPTKWKQENVGELTEFENAMMHIGGSFFGENAGLDPNDTDTIKEQAELLLELAPKIEWSEEDEDMIQALNACIDAAIKGGMNYISFGSKSILMGKVKNRLKSLKERYAWKPSEEQIKILNEILNFAANHENPYWNDYIFGTLNNLIRQLKKLKA